MSKKTILSGSTATGDLTIGNYIGAIAHWTKLQEEYDCYYMVADLHALTVKQDPVELKKRCYSFYAQYLALGLDPNKNVVFVQSHVPEHAELTWVLSCLTPMGYLNRMTQFKDKSQNNQNVNAGLYTYPVLMAADILLYQTDLVPVGEDQRQHLELTRDIVQFFQNRYGEGTFKMPNAYIGKVGARIMSLQDPLKKMSKSDPDPMGAVSIIDAPKKIEKKFKSAVTDSGSEIRFSPEDKPGISNLLTIYSIFSGKSISDLENEFSGKMYGHLKVALAELVVEKLKPVQEKYQQLMNDQSYLSNIISNSGERARERASQTLKAVYDQIGLVPGKRR